MRSEFEKFLRIYGLRAITVNEKSFALYNFPGVLISLKYDVDESTIFVIHYEGLKIQFISNDFDSSMLIYTHMRPYTLETPIIVHNLDDGVLDNNYETFVKWFINNKKLSRILMNSTLLCKDQWVKFANYMCSNKYTSHTV